MDLDDQIIVSLASIPARRAGLVTVIESLIDQCDRMFVCLNGHPREEFKNLPDCSRIYYSWQEHNIGPRGKFMYSSVLPGYHIIVDDDLIYPTNYVYTMIQHIERLKRQTVVGLHGKLLLYRRDQPMTFKFYRYDQEITDYEPVHMLGTGVMAYHRQVFDIDYRQLDEGKIDDQVALMAQQQRVPLIVVPHKLGWVQNNTSVSEIQALHQNMDLKRSASERIHSWPNWKLYTTDTNEVPNYF